MIIKFNNNENIQQIEDFEVSQNIKINKQLQNGLKFSNQMYFTLGNACNRMLI